MIGVRHHTILFVTKFQYICFVDKGGIYKKYYRLRNLYIKHKHNLNIKTNQREICLIIDFLCEIISLVFIY